MDADEQKRQADERKKKEAIQRFTQSRKRARPSFRGIWIALLGLAALLGLVVWWSWPHEDTTPLLVVAFDEAGLSDEPSLLHARLHPAAPPEGSVDLEGFDLYFADSLVESRPGAKGDKRLREKVATGPGGQAEVRWTFPPDKPVHSFVVRFAGDARRRGAYDQARIFSWPARTPLLVVEARHALMSATARRFHRARMVSIPPAPGAPAALEQARAKKFQVVYLATGPDQPDDYLKLRGWLQRPGPSGRPLLPDGPALGRVDYGDAADEAAAQRAVLRALKKRFRGPLVGVAGRGPDAKVFREAGLTTLLITDRAEAPEGVTKVESWETLGKHLP